jgi:hypothetical protein
VSSNIAQSYPYASESEEERAAALEAAFAAFEGLRETVGTETTALGEIGPADHGAPPRWWVWVCPRDDFRGRLHVAGYARDARALYTVCDTCGSTFLR